VYPRLGWAGVHGRGRSRQGVASISGLGQPVPRTFQERLLPDSVGSKNEQFRESAIFRRVFERAVEACIAAGLVGGVACSLGNSATELGGSFSEHWTQRGAVVAFWS